MSIRAVFKSASAALAVMAFGISGAIAQTCDITELGSANGEIYLHAQNELIVNNNAAAALAGINELRAQPLNCYEEGAVLGLSAQVKLAQQDYLGAAVDLRTSLNKGYIPAAERPNTLKALSQIYFAENQYADGLKFVNDWIAAGGVPNRDEKWTLATVYSIQGQYRQAVPWAEQVLAADGPNADRQVYDMLIYLYSQTNQLEKQERLLERLSAQDPTDNTGQSSGS